jgi:flagellin
MAFGDINRVNTNLQASSSRFSLNKVNERLADNQLKLSTGLRINKAEDDAAGFSIASKLSGRLAGLEQAERNVGDAKSTLDVAESGFNSVQDILVDIKAKATQGANGSIGDEERTYIKDQIESLASEINNIADQTTFQGTSLLGAQGDATAVGASLTFQVGENSGDTQQVDITATRADDLFDEASAALASTDDGATAATEEGIVLTDNTQATFNTLIGEIDGAINTLAGSFNQIGIDQNSLSIKQDNLSQSITANSAARSRIEDADFAKVQSESVKLQILQQTATSALAQANSSPQAVLGFLGG